MASEVKPTLLLLTIPRAFQLSGVHSHRWPCDQIFALHLLDVKLAPAPSLTLPSYGLYHYNALLLLLSKLKVWVKNLDAAAHQLTTAPQHQLAANHSTTAQWFNSSLDFYNWFTTSIQNTRSYDYNHAIVMYPLKSRLYSLNLQSKNAPYDPSNSNKYQMVHQIRVGICDSKKTKRKNGNNETQFALHILLITAQVQGDPQTTTGITLQFHLNGTWPEQCHRHNHHHTLWLQERPTW